MAERIIRALGSGEPMQRVWPLYIAFGAVAFGFLSVPSTGAAIALVPMFLIAGAIILYGCWVCPRQAVDRLTGRRLVVVGLALMILASWTRAIVLWGVDQRGAGSNIIATVVWVWITLGCAMVLIAVWTRGLS